MSSFRPVSLITGASFGIGAEFARLFATHGHETVLVSRNEARLNAVADGIAAEGASRPHVIPMDLSRLDSGARLAADLASRGLEPRFVVNNAGFGLVGAADELERAEQLELVDLNVRTLTDLSLRWLVPMRASKGGVLNVASVAGFMSGPGMGVYYASKAYVVSFTEALHYEMKSHGVRVTVVCPGPVQTGFQARANLKEMPVATLLEVSPAKVARLGYKGLMAGRRMVVPGIGNKMVVFLMSRLMPRGPSLYFTDSRQRMRLERGPPQWLKKGR
ncbi:MAG: SDR family oxidoreductase [Rhizobiales bacterium]|nr:SDR family oxidoreductase [Hyphomicrobiales bacterium]